MKPRLATTSTVVEELGTTANDDDVWITGTVNITAFAGQTVRIQFEASDTSTASLVEAAVNDVKIVQQQQQRPKAAGGGLIPLAVSYL